MPSDFAPVAAGARLLIVDDDAVLRGTLAHAFRRRGLVVSEAACFDDAMALAVVPFELALVDLRMPGRSGLELVVALRERWPALRVVVLTGYGSIATAMSAVRLGAAHYLPKPADVDDILAAFSGAPPSVSEPAEREPPTLERVEWEHIQRVLADSGDNISEAARRLGLHRRSLQRKLQRRPPRR